MLYKEDYEDKTTLTSLKFEDTSTETRRLSKSSCLLEGWQLAVLRAPVNVKKATQKKQEKKNRNWVLPLVLKADTWQDDTSQSGSRQCRTEKGLQPAGDISFLVKHNK